MNSHDSCTFADRWLKATCFSTKSREMYELLLQSETGNRVGYTKARSERRKRWCTSAQHVSRKTDVRGNFQGVSRFQVLSSQRSMVAWRLPNTLSLSCLTYTCQRMWDPWWRVGKKSRTNFPLAWKLKQGTVEMRNVQRTELKRMACDHAWHDNTASPNFNANLHVFVDSLKPLTTPFCPSPSNHTNKSSLAILCSHDRAFAFGCVRFLYFSLF